MMINTLNSQGFELDLNDGIPLPLNLSIADIREPQSRQRKFSKQIELPGTINNMNYFKGSFSLTVADSNITFDATAKVEAKLSKRGWIVLDGLIQLNNVTINDGNYKFTVTLYSDAVDIFLLLSNRRVSELDWTDYNHELNTTNIINSWTAATGSGYYYPLIEKDGNRLSDLTWRTVDMIPYIYLREAFLKSFEFVGIDVQSNFVDNPIFKDVLWGYGGGEVISVNAAEGLKRSVNASNIMYDSGTQFSIGSYNFDNQVYNFNFKFDFFGTNVTSFDSIDEYEQLNDMVLTALYGGTFEVGVDFDEVQFQFSTGLDKENVQVKVLVYRNGQFFDSIASEIQINTPALVQATFENAPTIEIALNSGDQITMQFEVSYDSENAGIGQNVFMSNVSPLLGNALLTYKSTQIQDGDTVVLSRFLPDMTCADLVLGAFRQFNLYMTDVDEQTVKIEPHPAFYKGTNDFDDWSELLDIEKDMIIKPAANEYGKRFILKFTEINETDAIDYSNKYGIPYGDLIYSQGGYYANGDKVVQMPWGTIVPNSVYAINGDTTIPRFITADAQTNEIKPCKAVPRIMYNTGLRNGVFQFRNESGSVSITRSTYPSVHHFNSYENPTFDLNFKLVSELYYDAFAVTNRNCFSEYYFEIVNEMTNNAGKFIEAYFKLTNEAVNTLDFSKLKMINGALFRLNAVKDFDADFIETTKCELTKVLRARSSGRVTKPQDPIAPDVPIFGELDPITDSTTGNVVGNKVPNTTFSNRIIIG
jgi:hypothetical protein